MKFDTQFVLLVAMAIAIGNAANALPTSFGKRDDDPVTVSVTDITPPAASDACISKLQGRNDADPTVVNVMCQDALDSTPVDSTPTDTTDATDSPERRNLGAGAGGDAQASAMIDTIINMLLGDGGLWAKCLGNAMGKGNTGAGAGVGGLPVPKTHMPVSNTGDKTPNTGAGTKTPTTGAVPKTPTTGAVPKKPTTSTGTKTPTTSTGQKMPPPNHDGGNKKVPTTTHGGDSHDGTPVGQAPKGHLPKVQPPRVPVHSGSGDVGQHGPTQGGHVSPVGVGGLVFPPVIGVHAGAGANADAGLGLGGLDADAKAIADAKAHAGWPLVGIIEGDDGHGVERRNNIEILETPEWVGMHAGALADADAGLGLGGLDADAKAGAQAKAHMGWPFFGIIEETPEDLESETIERRNNGGVPTIDLSSITDWLHAHAGALADADAGLGLQGLDADAKALANGKAHLGWPFVEIFGSNFARRDDAPAASPAAAPAGAAAPTFSEADLAQWIERLRTELTGFAQQALKDHSGDLDAARKTVEAQMQQIIAQGEASMKKGDSAAPASPAAASQATSGGNGVQRRAEDPQMKALRGIMMQVAALIPVEMKQFGLEADAVGKKLTDDIVHGYTNATVNPPETQQQPPQQRRDTPVDPYDRAAVAVGGDVANFFPQEEAALVNFYEDYKHAVQGQVNHAIDVTHDEAVGTVNSVPRRRESSEATEDPNMRSAQGLTNQGLALVPALLKQAELQIQALEKQVQGHGFQRRDAPKPAPGAPSVNRGGAADGLPDLSAFAPLIEQVDDQIASISKQLAKSNLSGPTGHHHHRRDGPALPGMPDLSNIGAQAQKAGADFAAGAQKAGAQAGKAAAGAAKEGAKISDGIDYPDTEDAIWNGLKAFLAASPDLAKAIAGSAGGKLNFDDYLSFVSKLVSDPGTAAALKSFMKAFPSYEKGFEEALKYVGAQLPPIDSIFPGMGEGTGHGGVFTPADFRRVANEAARRLQQLQ